MRSPCPTHAIGGYAPSSRCPSLTTAVARHVLSISRVVCPTLSVQSCNERRVPCVVSPIMSCPSPIVCCALVLYRALCVVLRLPHTSYHALLVVSRPRVAISCGCRSLCATCTASWHHCRGCMVDHMPGCSFSGGSRCSSPFVRLPWCGMRRPVHLVWLFCPSSLHVTRIPVSGSLPISTVVVLRDNLLGAVRRRFLHVVLDLSTSSALVSLVVAQ